MSDISLEELWDLATQGDQKFDTAMVASLPEPAHRILTHAIAPGTQLASAVRLKMHGEIKLKGWMPFVAEQVISWPRGMIWRATVGKGLMKFKGFDRVVDGEGEMCWRLFGLFPVVQAKGVDIVRSAIGRMVAESIWLPSVLLSDGAVWGDGDSSGVTARVSLMGESTKLGFGIADSGRLQSVSLQRWGDPGGAPFRYEPFGGIVEEEATFNGYTIPSQVRVGWYFGSDRFESEGEFFRVTIDSAEYR